MKKFTLLALAICFSMNTFAQSDCGDTVIHCYTSYGYKIFDSTVANSGDYITVTINAGGTESGYDDLVVYDSSDSSGNILYSADGNHAGQVITSTTGSISVWIDGDGSYNCTDGDGGPYVDLNMSISCAPAPSCLAPTDLVASLVSSGAMAPLWTDANSDSGTEWNIEWGLTDFVQGDGTQESISSTFAYAVTGLTPNTSYDFYVQANCGTDETSSWTGPLQFTTLCAAVTEFSENFDSVTTPQFPDCWSGLISSGLSSYAYVETATFADASEPNGVEFYNSSSTTGDIILVSPRVSNLAANTHRLKLKAKNTSSTQDIQIGTLSDPSNSSTFTLLETVDINTTFTEYVIDFSSYSGTDTYIGFRRLMSSSYTSVYLDDIVWEEIPSCEPVIDLATSNLTNTSADLSWTAGATQTTWNIEYGATGFDLGAGTTVAVTANSYALMGLTANTSYDFYVQADCDANGFSAWVGPETFTTDSDPIVPNYTNDFSSIYDGFWSFGSGALTSSPVIITNDDAEWFLAYFGNDTSRSDSAAINLYADYNTWLISSTFDLSGGTYYLNLDAAATEFNTTDDAIFGTDIFATLMTSTDGGSTWNELYRWNADNNPGADGTSMPEIELTGYTASSKFAIYGESSSSNFSDDIDFFADNFSITATSLGMDTLSTSNFTYFPNPVNNVLSIKAQASIDSITVYNMLGQTVVKSTPNTTTTAVDMSKLQTGAYFVQVAINNSIETVRVIKN